MLIFLIAHHIHPPFAQDHHPNQQNGVVDDSPPDELGASSQNWTVVVISNKFNM